MSKRQLRGKEVLLDTHSGLDDAALMDKYKLSAQGLQSILQNLFAASVLKQAELDRGILGRMIDYGSITGVGPGETRQSL